MTIKAYINNDQTATFVCPQCQKPRIMDVSKYIVRNTEIKLKVTCGCGHQYVAYLEKRKKFRKQTNLDGIYKYTVTTPDHKTTEGIGKLTVVDISLTGLRAKLHSSPRFAVGDKINLEIKLNDANRTIVRKEVLVQNIHELYVGFEFVFNDPYDSALGFYVLSKT
jgi:c-di-GMP-binding flagellar brake protein YcgR